MTTTMTARGDVFLEVKLDRVREELDCLVRLRFAGPFTPEDQHRYDSLIAREIDLLERLDGRPRYYGSTRVS